MNPSDGGTAEGGSRSPNAMAADKRKKSRLERERLEPDTVFSLLNRNRVRRTRSTSRLVCIEKFMDRREIGQPLCRAWDALIPSCSLQSHFPCLCLLLRPDRVGSGRIWPNIGGKSDSLWIIWLRFCFVSTSAFSQRHATTCFMILYLGSFRKNTFSHRDLSNPKCSFSRRKTIFSGFDRVHHLGSFCKFAAAPAEPIPTSRLGRNHRIQNHDFASPPSFSPWLPP